MNEFLVVGVLFGIVALRVLAVRFLVLLIIRPVRGCPACFEPTAPIRKRWLFLLGRNLEWRWCAACGWEGIARRMAVDREEAAGPAAVRHPSRRTPRR